MVAQPVPPIADHDAPPPRTAHVEAGGAADHPFLPVEAPLDMPRRPLHAPARPGPRPRPGDHMGARRLAVVGGATAMAAAGAWEMHRVLDVGGVTALEWLVLALFTALFAWIALSCTSALAGFAAMMGGGKRALGIDPAAPLPPVRSRTALLMPIYNESTARVMAGLEAIHGALRETGALDRFDIFILSDTTDANLWIAEEAAFLDLRDRTGGHGRIFYRRRRANIERKAGNIAEWVRRFGGAYPHMLVLDADSIMTGDSIVRLAAAMEAHPGIGLIQTLPVLVNGTTLFARMQQFASRVYGPVIAHGIAWWHGDESNYWGHNAILRTAAFAAEGGLPILAGRKPFGGHVLSHDFVEAALIRRGGWAVRLVPGLPGSYEESPASLVDLSIRDRRWCQGNLQHAGVLPARGLHWVSRLHLLMGVGSYVTAPMTLLFLLAGIAITLQAEFIGPEYFPGEFNLFPSWPAQDPIRAAWLFVATMGVLLVPKLLGMVALILDRSARRGAGGAARVVAGTAVETVLTALLTPLTMLSQSVAVGAILAGRDAGWAPQRRGDGGVPPAVIARRYAYHTVFGLGLGLASYAASPTLLLWMSPFVLGLALAIPASILTGSRRAGLALRRVGLLRTPEEHAPPGVVRQANALHAALAPGVGEGPGAAILRLLSDPRLLEAHRRNLAPAPRRRGGAPIDGALVFGFAKLDDAASLADALVDLDGRETAALLANPAGVERLAAMARRDAERRTAE